MHNVSSQLTLFFKVFVPTIWISFFCTIGGFLLLSEAGQANNMSMTFGATLFGTIVLSFLLIGIGLLYFFLMRLKRVEFDNNFLYATNYIKHYRYPFHNIDYIEVKRFLLWRPTRVVLKTPGKFGKRFTFLANNQLKAYLDKNPLVAQELQIKGEDKLAV